MGQDNKGPKGLVGTEIGRTLRVRVQELEGWPMTH